MLFIPTYTVTQDRNIFECVFRTPKAIALLYTLQCTI